MNHLQINSINNVFDALRVRDIRNECRLYMTKNQSIIPIYKQIIWYFINYLPNNNMHCYLIRKDKENVGYGLVVKKGNRYWITGGLFKNARGKGYGKELFRLVISKIKSDDIWLEVLDTNKIARKIYKELGFEVASKIKRNNKNIITMKMNKNG